MRSIGKWRGVWIGTDLTLWSPLPANVARQRLLYPIPYVVDNMTVYIRHRPKSDEFRIIAIRRGRSNGLQRFLWCTVMSTGSGSVVQGEFRARRVARWFLNYWLLFAGSISLVFTVGTIGTFIVGRPAAGLDGLLHTLFILAFLLGGLAFAESGMQMSAGNEVYLREWLAERLEAR